MLRYAILPASIFVLAIGSPSSSHGSQTRTDLRSVAKQGEKKYPNIIFLLADDLRWNVLGCTGDKLAKTPNLDTLAKRGVNFRNRSEERRVGKECRSRWSP